MAYLVTLDFEANELQRLRVTDKNAYHLNWYAKDKIVLAINDHGNGSLAFINLKFKTVNKTILFSKPLSYPTPYKNGFLVQTLDNNKDCIAFIGADNQNTSLNNYPVTQYCHPPYLYKQTLSKGLIVPLDVFRILDPPLLSLEKRSPD